MARLALSKSSLQKERRKLANFERFLPSLDLKRRQLMMERAKATEELRGAEEELEKFLDGIGELADPTFECCLMRGQGWLQ